MHQHDHMQPATDAVQLARAAHRGSWKLFSLILDEYDIEHGSPTAQLIFHLACEVKYLADRDPQMSAAQRFDLSYTAAKGMFNG